MAQFTSCSVVTPYFSFLLSFNDYMLTFTQILVVSV